MGSGISTTSRAMASCSGVSPKAHWQVKKIVDDRRESEGCRLRAHRPRLAAANAPLGKLPLAGGEPQRITAGGWHARRDDGARSRNVHHALEQCEDPRMRVPARSRRSRNVRVIARPNIETAMLKAYDLAEPHFVQMPTREWFPDGSHGS
jgi:hypothetical protein